MNTKEKFFITIEGGEGAGKTTHSLLLKEFFENKGFNVFLTREPGGTVLAENVRKILLNPSFNVSPISELFLYEAARAQHIQEIIKPALKKNQIVICDRFIDATIAYQGFGRKIDLNTIETLNDIASFNLKPSLTIYLDIQPVFGLSKAKGLDKESYGKKGDRIEREKLSFHKNVRKGYLYQAKKYPKRIRVIKTTDDIKYTQQLIREEISKCLKIF
jgi:dTMP kinase